MLPLILFDHRRDRFHQELSGSDTMSVVKIGFATVLVVGVGLAEVFVVGISGDHSACCGVQVSCSVYCGMACRVAIGSRGFLFPMRMLSDFYCLLAFLTIIDFIMFQILYVQQGRWESWSCLTGVRTSHWRAGLC